MKKKLVLLISVLIVFGCVAGCGKSANDAAAEQQDLQAQEDSQDDDSEYDDDSRYVNFNEYDYSTENDDDSENEDDSEYDEEDSQDDSEEEEVEPVDPSAYEGTLLGYSVADLDGNMHNLCDFAAGKKVIMLNYWGTFCGPCIGEMYDLGDLERKYKDQGFEIIGVTMDVVKDDGSYYDGVIDDAKDIVDSTGVTYPVVVAGVDIVKDMNICDYPTTIFVDGEGNQISDRMDATRDLNSWEETIRNLLGL